MSPNSRIRRLMGKRIFPVPVEKPIPTAKIIPLPDFPVFKMADFDKGLKEAVTVDEWFQNLGNWDTARPGVNDAEHVGKPETTTEEHSGQKRDVTRTKYSITQTPDQFVTFQPVNAFWLGGLVQEKGLKLGLAHMREIGVEAEKRAPFTITSDLPIDANFREIKEPSSSAVSSALASLLGSNARGGGSATFRVVDNYSEEQAALALGLNAKYLVGDLQTAFKTKRHYSKHTISAAYIERAVTFQADFRGRTRKRAFFSSTFTVDDAKALTANGEVTNNNLPGYVKSITYGRVVIFTLTSTLDEEQMSAGISANVRVGRGGGGADVSTSSSHSDTVFELSVTKLGGASGTVSELIPSTKITGLGEVLGNMRDHLKGAAPLISMVPISYTINTLRDGQLMKMAHTTEYVVPRYLSLLYRIKMWVTILKSDDGFQDNTLECYGTLRVNGDVWWHIPRDDAGRNAREKNQTLEISECPNYRRNRKRFEIEHFSGTGPLLAFDLSLSDHDSGSSDDPIGKFKDSIDLKVMAADGKTKTWDWDSKDGEATRLHVRVERV